MQIKYKQCYKLYVCVKTIHTKIIVSQVPVWRKNKLVSFPPFLIVSTESMCDVHTHTEQHLFSYNKVICTSRDKRGK